MQINKDLINRIKAEPIAVAAYNLLIALAVYYVCRIAFFLFNLSYFPDMRAGHFFTLLKGGLQFDISALAYTNILYVLLQILPFRFRLNRVYQTVAKWIFVVINSLSVVANCFDIVFFRFSNRRTTLSFFSEFQNENNRTAILLEGMANYWYVTLTALALIFLLYKLYCMPRKNSEVIRRRPLWNRVGYYALHTALMFGVIFLTVVAMRGGAEVGSRPITISNANVYVKKSAETAIVLNTPFSMIRTATKKVYVHPHYFATDADAEKIFSPIHHPQPDGDFKPLNVVILIVESFGKEYSGFFNHDLDNGTYSGFTPFVDSLYAEGLTFKYSYCNGRKSIDAMPSILSGIPMFIEPFILTHYSTDDISGVASILKEKGYYSAFFHGAPNGSMGFSAYARSAGFDDYFGLNEYGDKDLDGMWAVWDEEFLQYYARKMGELPQPFVTAVFTATSHDPFRIPKQYKGRFPEGTQPIHKCIGYTDYAIRRFFETMKQYEWYENTLFVLTADHTNQTSHREYMTDVNSFAVPILFYHPANKGCKGMVDSIPVQQIDITPTILGYLNYDKPYFAFGQDVFHTPACEKFAVNYNNQLYQIFRHDRFLQFDGQTVKGFYDWKNDVFLQNNLAGNTQEQKDSEQVLKAVVQQYIGRIIENRLRVK